MIYKETGYNRLMVGNQCDIDVYDMEDYETERKAENRRQIRRRKYL